MKSAAKKQAGGETEKAAPPKKLPHVLLAYQKEWIADEADVAIWEKSRRIGASWTDAGDSVLTSAKTGGMDSLYIGYSLDMAREYIDACAMWARALANVAA